MRSIPKEKEFKPNPYEEAMISYYLEGYSEELNEAWNEIAESEDNND